MNKKKIFLVAGLALVVAVLAIGDYTIMGGPINPTGGVRLFLGI